MAIAAKPIIAGTLLLGVTTVWVPKLTGFDPLGMLPEELPSSSSVPSSSSMGGTVPTQVGTEEAGTTEEDGVPMGSLEDIVGFLENRSRGHAPTTVDNGLGAGASNTTPPAVDPITPYVIEVEQLDEPTTTVEVAGPTFAEELQAFLGANPLHTIIDGGGVTTATLGYQRVRVGDALLDERVHVQQIDQRGIVLETPDGAVRVLLPPQGVRTHRRARTPQEQEAPTEDTPPDE